jgi:CubicO group peptidase (beta-lactamase class C family)
VILGDMQMHWLFQFIAMQCCRAKMPGLRVDPSLPLEHRMDALGDWLATLHARGIFNGTVLIAGSGEVCFERHYGFADIAEAVPLTDHSSFSLASVSKQFTAMGIMLLAQRRKLTLDDSVATHIPELADYREVTIRQLLQHTSGMPDHMGLADAHWDARNLLTMADLIDLLRRHRLPLDFPPGERFAYSNTGYALLGEIIARVSGQPYPDFMANEVFQPLGMNDSAAFNLASARCTLQCRVFGFRKRFLCFGQKVLYDLNHLDGVFGDGGIYASAEDLVRWDRALREGTLIPCDIHDQAYVTGRLKSGAATGYGFGWDIEAPHVVAHRGEWLGFTSYLRRDLKRQTLLVLLSNQGPSACVDAIGAEIGEVVEAL